MSMRRAKGILLPQVSILKVSTTRGKNNMRTYREHLTNSFDCLLTHLHHPTLDAVAFRNLQGRPGAMSIIHHRDEFWFVDLVEWLVTCDDPFSQELLELVLVPWTLSNTLSHTSIEMKERVSLTPARACWSSNAFLMFSEEVSSCLVYSVSVLQSNFFLPDAYAIS